MANEKDAASLTGQTEHASKKPRKKGVVAGVIAAVIVVAGVGFMAWHEQPSFCANAICHASMGAYYDTYSAVKGEPTTDKWGNEVADAAGMMSVVHQAEGVTCLQCHVPSLGQQMTEGGLLVTGNYAVPLEEVDAKNLLANADRASESGLGDELCMNDSCHSDLSREALTEKTADLAFNPHSWQHRYNQCTDCHKSHRASTLVCTECHGDVAGSIMPEGWVDAAAGDAAEEALRG